jgi:peptidoglycan hydrolase-like protein with peptidoglycan-binding domain
MKELIIALQKKLGVTADGVIGKQTLAAIAKFIGADVAEVSADTVKNIQRILGVNADGIIGPQTLNAIINSKTTVIAGAENLLIQKYIDKPVQFSKVAYKAKPVTQSALRGEKSIFGKAGDESYLVNVKVPSNYPLKYDGTPVKSIRIHKLAADRLEAALNDIINHYGEDIETVAPGACVYDGSYNFRKTRSSSSQSVHSWGVAIDFDASKNQLNTKAPVARLSQDIYKPFLDILEHHGFLSLGRRSNKDWMHVQMTLWG